MISSQKQGRYEEMLKIRNEFSEPVTLKIIHKGNGIQANGQY